MKYRLLKVRNIVTNYSTYHSSVADAAKRCFCSPVCVYRAIQKKKICNYEYEIQILCTDGSQCIQARQHLEQNQKKVLSIHTDLYKDTVKVPEWFDNLFGEPIV